MKILSMWTRFLPQVGGLEVVVQQQAEGLARVGHNVRVMTTLHGLIVAARRVAAVLYSDSSPCEQHDRVLYGGSIPPYRPAICTSPLDKGEG